jgi:hypothetical protein
MKKGKEPMRTFGDLMQFFETKTEDKKPPVPNQKEQGEERAPAAADAPAAETATESAVPVAGTAMPVELDVVDANRAAPPEPPPPSEPAESLSPALSEPAPDLQTPPANKG